jgi:hypothetical protein
MPVFGKVSEGEVSEIEFKYNAIDKTGMKFGRLLLIERIRANRRIAYRCLCDCGNEKIVYSYCFTEKNPTRSCGCLQREQAFEMGKAKLIDITGKRFGHLIAMHRVEDDSNGNPRWECLCVCGRTTIKYSASLRGGFTRSCGCVIKEMNKDILDLYRWKLGENKRNRRRVIRESRTMKSDARGK